MTRWRWIYAGTLVLALVVGLGLWSPFDQAVAKKQDVPRFIVDPFWPKPLPVSTVGGATKPWVSGEVAGTCIDSRDHVFTVNRGPQGNLVAPETLVAIPSTAVMEFDRAGNVVNAWPANVATPGVNGGFSAPPGLPTGLHGCFVDYQDNVWIAGNGDGIVQKYTHDGHLLMQIGTHNVCDNPPANNCGNSGGNPVANKSHTLLNQPADIAVDPSNGDIYIADGYGNHRIVVFDKNGNFLRQWGSVGSGPGLFAAGDGGHPHCVVLGKDGLVYACDRGQDRIQVFEKIPKVCAPTGIGGEPVCQPVKIIPVVPGTGTPGLGTAGSAWDLDFSPDKNQTFMYETDGGNEVLWIFDRLAALAGASQTAANGQGNLAGFGRPGHQAGEFTFLHTVALDSRGNLFTGETINGRRIQKFKQDGDVSDNKLSVFVPAGDFAAGGDPTLRLRHYNPVKGGGGGGGEDRDDDD